jgi:hypothetical protein
MPGQFPVVDHFRTLLAPDRSDRWLRNAAQVTGDWQLTSGQVPFGLSGGFVRPLPGWGPTRGWLPFRPWGRPGGRLINGGCRADR